MSAEGVPVGRSTEGVPVGRQSSVASGFEKRGSLGAELSVPVLPTTDSGWKSFHAENEEGMSKAYASDHGWYQEGSTLFVAGTRGFGDVLDWPKIPLGTFRESHIYKNVQPVFAANPSITRVVGHSAGGSAALELERNFPDRKVQTVTYNAPVFEPRAPDLLLPGESRPLRFAIAGDPASLFDRNARVTLKAPNFNLKAIEGAVEAFVNPSPDTAIKAASTQFESLLSLHSMTGSYSEPSKPLDFANSAVEGVAAAEALMLFAPAAAVA